MKTKLELYLAVQTCAEKTLDAKPAIADKAFTDFVKPLNLAPDDAMFAGQLFASRRQRMLQLRDEPLIEVPKPADAKKN